MGTSTSEKPLWLTDGVMKQLLSKDVNGREIKNIMRVAHALARSAKRGIEATDIFQGLEAYTQFKLDFQEEEETNQASAVDLKAFGLLRSYEMLLAFLVSVSGYLRRVLRTSLRI